MLIRPALPADDAEIAALLDAAFGAGRHARTASKLRVGATPIAGPSLVARCDGTDDITPCTPGALLGSIQLWPIALIADDDGAGANEMIAFTLLGPVAVAASARSIGLGRELIGAALAVADAAGLDPILLIGDFSYYGRFGFTADATGGWGLPGPVERDRLLLRQRIPRTLPRDGEVVPASSVTPPPVRATADA